MRPLSLTCLVVLTGALVAAAADVESRVLTHYLPQDFLETAVRTENWTEVPLDVKGGVRKGDTVRIWTGGSIDRGGDRPGDNVGGPTGPEGKAASVAPAQLALALAALALATLAEGPVDIVRHAVATGNAADLAELLHGPMGIVRTFLATLTREQFVVPICTALGFARVLRHTGCDQHLVHLL